jgi:DNA-directed RNA polymerase specialized sigma24 family protein
VSTYIDSMNDGVRLAEQAGSQDPAVGLRAVRALRELSERLESLQVASARDRGWSWQEIATCLGVSRQAVHKKHGGGRRFLGKEK